MTQTTAGIQAGISAMLSASDIPYFAPEETRRLFPVWTPLRFAVGVKSATLRFEHNPPYEVEDRTYFIVQIPFVQIALRL